MIYQNVKLQGQFFATSGGIYCQYQMPYLKQSSGKMYLNLSKSQKTVSEVAEELQVN